MKIFLLAVLTCFLSQICICQHAQVVFSNDFKIAENEYKDQTVSHSVYHDNNFYTVTNSGVGVAKWLFTKLYDVKFSITVSKFDRNMNKIKETELENGSKSFGPLMPELFLLNNKLFLAYFQNENNSSFSLYFALLDNTNLSINNSKKICTIQQENVGIFKLESVLDGGLIYLCNSDDNKRILVVSKSSPNTLETFIVDDSLNVLKKNSLSNTGTEFKVTSAVLTKDNLSCLVLESEQENKFAYISPDGKKSQTALKGLGDLKPYITRLSLSRDNKNVYVYSTSSSSGRDCNGLFISQLDCSTLQLSRPLTYEFSSEFIEIISKKGGGSKQKKEYYMFNFTPSLLELENGSLAIIGSPEMTSVSTSTSVNMNNQARTKTTTTLNVGPIIAFFPDKNSSSFGYVIVPRKIVFSRSQSSGSGAIKVVQAPGLSYSSSSFITTNINDETVILYNDNETNLKNNESDKITTTYSTTDFVIAEALISKDKKLQYRKQIGENLKGNYTYYLGNAIPNSSSSVIFPIGKGGVGFNALKTFFTNWCFINIK